MKKKMAAPAAAAGQDERTVPLSVKKALKYLGE